MYSQLPSILEAVPPSANWGYAMPWWQGPTYHGHYVPSHRKLSGYEEILSDIQKVCWYLTSLPKNNTEMILQQTFHLLWWQTVYYLVLHMYIYKCGYRFEYECLWSREITVEDICILPVIGHNEYYFFFQYDLHSQTSCRGGVLIAVNEILVHMHTHLSHRWRSSSVMSRISCLLTGLLAVRNGGRIMSFMLCTLCS